MGATEDYEVVDGAIQCKAGRGGNLLTQETYGNFVVRLEFRLPPGGNNGLAVRTPGPAVDAAYEGLEIQVLDNDAPQYAQLHDYQYHGSIYGLVPAARGYLRPVGEWNYEEVVVDRDHVEFISMGSRSSMQISTRRANIPPMASHIRVPAVRAGTSAFADTTTPWRFGTYVSSLSRKGTHLARFGHTKFLPPGIGRSAAANSIVLVRSSTDSARYPLSIESVPHCFRPGERSSCETANTIAAT